MTTTKTAIIAASAAAAANIDPQLGIDVGATHKDYLRDLRIRGILATNCLSQMAAEDAGADETVLQADGEQDSDVCIPEGCTADDTIPGTTWTYGQALEMIAERRQDERRGWAHLYN